MNEKSRQKLKEIAIIRHRKNKNLCLKCGLNIHDGNCKNESYEKADMRKESEKEKIKDSSKQKDTVIYYRQKKNLCLKCGLDIHVGNCKNESYEKADMRPESEKKKRPAIVKTPKKKSKTILEQLSNKNPEFITSYNNTGISLLPTKKITLHRDFVVLNLEPSDKGFIIEFSFINVFSKKYKDYIICMKSGLEKYFTYSELLKLKKMTNIHEIKTINDQTYINYLHSCSKFFSYPNRWTNYCYKQNINVHEFNNNRNINNYTKI